jgi:hypothetical protein
MRFGKGLSGNLLREMSGKAIVVVSTGVVVSSRRKIDQAFKIDRNSGECPALQVFEGRFDVRIGESSRHRARNSSSTLS